MKVHPEAVDALARWECNQDGEDWDTLHPDVEDHYLFHARRRLEAAASVLVAHEFRKAAAEIRKEATWHSSTTIGRILEERARQVEGK